MTIKTYPANKGSMTDFYDRFEHYPYKNAPVAEMFLMTGDPDYSKYRIFSIQNYINANPQLFKEDGKKELCCFGIRVDRHKNISTCSNAHSYFVTIARNLLINPTYKSEPCKFDRANCPESSCPFSHYKEPIQNNYNWKLYGWKTNLIQPSFEKDEMEKRRFYSGREGDPECNPPKCPSKPIQKNTESVAHFLTWDRLY